MKPPSGGPQIGPTSAGMVTSDMALNEQPLVDAADENKPAHRRHHRSTDALNDAREHEFVERARQRAAD